ITGTIPGQGPGLDAVRHGLGAVVDWCVCRDYRCGATVWRHHRNHARKWILRGNLGQLRRVVSQGIGAGPMIETLGPRLLLLVGLVTLVGKIYADSEPGALPLLLISLAVIWYIVIRIGRQA